MKNLIYITLSLSLISCSSLVDVSSPELSTVSRIEIDQETYDKPQFYISDFKFSKASRSIASSAPIEGVTYENELSNRQLYFLTYFKQYKTLSKILGKSDEIKSCPSFHNVVLDHEKALSEFRDVYSFDVKLDYLKSAREQIVNHPVVAIPYSDRTDLLSVLVRSDFKNVPKQVEEAVSHYYLSQKKEIETLCDTGVSPGYYIYENLVNYFQNDAGFHATKEGLMALLKVPVISNMIIVDNLINTNKDQFEYNSSKFENSLLERSKVTWFKQYRESIKKARQGLTSSRTVAGEKI